MHLCTLIFMITSIFTNNANSLVYTADHGGDKGAQSQGGAGVLTGRGGVLGPTSQSHACGKEARGGAGAGELKGVSGVGLRSTSRAGESRWMDAARGREQRGGEITGWDRVIKQFIWSRLRIASSGLGTGSASKSMSQCSSTGSGVDCLNTANSGVDLSMDSGLETDIASSSGFGMNEMADSGSMDVGGSAWSMASTGLGSGFVAGSGIVTGSVAEDHP